MNGGKRPHNPSDIAKRNEAAEPARQGTQFFLHPNATDAEIEALATAIVAQAARDRKENGEYKSNFPEER